MSQDAPLPPVLAQIARVAGRDAALALAKARGGEIVYFPLNPSPDHWLSGLIGHEAACAVCEQLTGGVLGTSIEVPFGPVGIEASRRAKADAMLRQGASHRDISKATQYTMRNVRYRKRSLADRHPDLFED